MNNKNLIVEIRGVGFVNKGAELMLHAVVSEMKKQYVNSHFIIEVTYSQLANKSNRDKLIQRLKRADLGVRLSGSFKRIPINMISRFLFPDLHRNVLVKTEREVRLVLDASGFAFGDQWGANFAKKRLADHIVRWRSSGKAIILLPQAFGPFSNVDVQKEVKKIMNNSDLIFARDQISFNYIRSLSEDSNKVILSPDFTNLISPDLGKFKEIYGNMVAVIPNFKMIDGDPESADGQYIDLLQNSIEKIQSRGVKAFFLMHEGVKDEKIAILINKRLRVPIDIVWEDSSVGIKAIIGASYAVITSRFHGLVSALSQSVPCLATSWSHKYEMLLQDYDHSSGLVGLESSDEDLDSKIATIVDVSSNTAIRKKLNIKSLEQKGRTKEMWKTIYDFLEKNYDIK